MTHDLTGCARSDRAAPRWLLGVVALCLCGGADPAQAQRTSRLPPSSPAARGTAVAPGAAGTTPSVRRTIEELIDEATTLEEGAHNAAEDDRIALLTRAVAVLERALQLDPHHVEARYDLGKVLGDAVLGPESLARAVRELQRARTDDHNDSLDYDLSQGLGAALSRQGRFAEAIIEYDRSLRALRGAAVSPGQLRTFRALALGNSAEALMAQGRLDEAIARYSQAEALETTDNAALHSLGLAVAYDRDGQREKSKGALLRSLTTDPAMRLFQSDQVFFVPPGDRHYYVALAAEAFGDREKAQESWLRFLRELPQSRYAAKAREHLDELRRTPGLSGPELARAEVTIGDPLFPPERPVPALGRRPFSLLPRLRGEEDIIKVAQEHRMELRQCYARALRRDARLAGDLEIALVLDRHGAVAMAEVLRGSFAREGVPTSERETQGPAAQELVQCATAALRRWRFSPADVEHDELALPLHFEARPQREGKGWR